MIDIQIPEDIEQQLPRQWSRCWVALKLNVSGVSRKIAAAFASDGVTVAVLDGNRVKQRRFSYGDLEHHDSCRKMVAQAAEKTLAKSDMSIPGTLEQFLDRDNVVPIAFI